MLRNLFLFAAVSQGEVNVIYQLGIRIVILTIDGGRINFNGVAAFDTESGFWLIHSAPGFPPKKAINKVNYAYPPSALKYGQIFLCVSFKTSSNLLSIVKLMRVNRVKIYDKNNPEIFSKATNAELMKLINDAPIDFKVLMNSRKDFLFSIGEVRFKGFAKNANFGEDLYDALVAPTLKCDLAVETWKRKSPLPNSGDIYKVLNIDAVEMPFRTSTMSNYYFNATKDHSKFAVCINNEGDWVCIGDINREVYDG